MNDIDVYAEFQRWVEEMELVFESGAELRDALRRCGISRKELASRMGVTPQLVTKILSGRQNMTLTTLHKAARAMDHRVSVRVCWGVTAARCKFSFLIGSRREIRGLSIEQAAADLRISTDCLQRLERGDEHPTLPILQRILCYYDIDFYVLAR